MRGAPVGWRAVTGARPKDGVALPGYPFRRGRHWCDDVPRAAAPVRRRGWFATRLDSPGLTAPVHVDRLGPADVPGLSDSGGLVHVGLHLAFVAAALGRTGPEPVVLADAVFLRALVLDAERELPQIGRTHV